MKYLHVFFLGLQGILAYRMNFFFRAIFGLIPLWAKIYIWQTIYRGKGEDETIATYTLARMISYYIAVAFVEALTAVTDDDWRIAGEIRDGKISQFLLKPVDYLTYRLSLFLAGRTVYLAISALPIGCFILIQHQYLVFPSDLTQVGLFLLSVVLTGLLQFLISYTMALLAFWILEVGTFIFILFAFENVAGGYLFPIDILPAGLAGFLSVTPFYYLMFFPISIYLGQVQGAALWRGLAIQAAWVAIAFLAARWIWRRGIKKYSAVGG